MGLNRGDEVTINGVSYIVKETYTENGNTYGILFDENKNIQVRMEYLGTTWLVGAKKAQGEYEKGRDLILGTAIDQEKTKEKVERFIRQEEEPVVHEVEAVYDDPPKAKKAKENFKKVLAIGLGAVVAAAAVAGIAFNGIRNKIKPRQELTTTSVGSLPSESSRQTKSNHSQTMSPTTSTANSIDSSVLEDSTDTSTYSDTTFQSADSAADKSDHESRDTNTKETLDDGDGVGTIVVLGAETVFHEKSDNGGSGREGTVAEDNMYLKPGDRVRVTGISAVTPKGICSSYNPSMKYGGDFKPSANDMTLGELKELVIEMGCAEDDVIWLIHVSFDSGQNEGDRKGMPNGDRGWTPKGSVVRVVDPIGKDPEKKGDMIK